MQGLLKKVAAVARQAGDAIMGVYSSEDFDVQVKSDSSPLTRADRVSNDCIIAGLERISAYPVVSEENEQRSAAEGGRFWLVDPLDGTKEFVKRNGEFTVNIALIDSGRPVLGVVYVPTQHVTYMGTEGTGAYKQMGNHQARPIRAVYKGKVPTVVVSRSHRDERISQFLADLGEHKEVSMGSSLKLCLVAEGAATVYPRFAPTHIWDTAAADSVVRAAGGTVCDLEGRSLRYSLDGDLKNPYFTVRVGESKVG